MKRLMLLVVLAALMGLLVACGGAVEQAAQDIAPTLQAAAEELAPTVEAAVEEVAPTVEAAVEEAVATEVPAAEEAAAEGTFLERAKAGEFAGTTVTLLGVMVDEEAQKMELALAPFEEATGIDVVYEGSKEFETQINVAVDAGAAPDVANISQPAMAQRFATAGALVDVSTFLPREKLQETYIDSWIDMSTMPGADGEDIIAGVWQRASAKSMVFYPKAQFDAAGYVVPETWEEMLALTQQIADDGDTAWCIGIESGAATGWVATDWMENIMLRTTSLENYDKWVTGELDFASPEVTAAAEKMAEIWLNEDYVYGGVASIVSTFIGDSPVPMFADPPGCWFHTQAAWITSFFGDETLVAGEDYDFFYLPPIDESLGRPALVAGDMMVMFNDRPEVRALMEFFSRAEGVEGWVRAGGTLSPHKDADLEWYTTYIDGKVAEMLLNATSVRFDASDLMPAEVGSGSFWKAMTDWVSGSTDLQTALSEIDASWPE
ncbi:Alpha-glucoside transport system substrate-binding protein [Candidatus Promineifilum breve]|uniref:Alpha-glucoside transport system substrate-binding protein n=2 Tax=Candidatus Promineifilum breve TaxID=1806508 RepID=A0A170PIH8_9CHLR|nr:Alpha-glucoside transport system substrate-binding protein [Candidatus Promineifilum breve]